ncbi:MAG: ABC transporter permease [Phycisphaeraceae bacterium]|nr:ABC transporter permease [Phycisphaeraceae bacterium]
MYKLLLTFRYLRRKIIPVLAALGVALCTSMVIVVVSVTGYFMERYAQMARRTQGDARIAAVGQGLTHYDELLSQLRELPEIKAATAVIVTFGFARGAYSTGAQEVLVLGVDPASYGAVLPYVDILRWDSESFRASAQAALDGHPPLGDEDRQRLRADLQTAADGDWLDYAKTLRLPANWPAWYGDVAPAVVGQELFGGARELMAQGSPMVAPADRRITLMMFPRTRRGAVIEPVVRPVVVVNEFALSFEHAESRVIFVPFAFLQSALLMDAHEAVDSQTGEAIGGQASGGQVPARASSIVIRARKDVDVGALKLRLKELLTQFSATYPDVAKLHVRTWEEDYNTFFQEMKRERFLLTLCFVIVSVVAFVMIGVVLYMIVLQKTRDIGTLRALGASRVGIAALFLGQGLAIGLVGSAVGLAVGAFVVAHLEEIYQLTTTAAGLGSRIQDAQDWDRLAGRLDAAEIGWIMLVVVGSSVLGALIPALLAARLDPVEALRYE